MLDKSLPYYNIIMKRDIGKQIPKAYLPEGYSFVLFSKGDEKEWAEIEASVGEFDSAKEALAYFESNYTSCLSEAKRRVLFIQNIDNKKVATLTNWWEYTNLRRIPAFHWVGVHKDFQGLGLGKAIVFEGLKRMIEIEGDREIYLHTQTWSFKAVNIYLKAGFEIMKTETFGKNKNDYEKAIETIGTMIGQ